MTTKEILARAYAELDGIGSFRDEDVPSKVGRAMGYIKFILEFPEHVDDLCPRSACMDRRPL